MSDLCSFLMVYFLSEIVRVSGCIVMDFEVNGPFCSMVHYLMLLFFSPLNSRTPCTIHDIMIGTEILN